MVYVMSAAECTRRLLYTMFNSRLIACESRNMVNALIGLDRKINVRKSTQLWTTWRGVRSTVNL